MSGSKVRYVLDANPFIEAKQRYYSFGLCPGFWKSLIDQHKAQRVFCVDRIESELAGQGDELSEWVDATVPDTFEMLEELGVQFVLKTKRTRKK